MTKKKWIELQSSDLWELDYLKHFTPVGVVYLLWRFFRIKWNRTTISSLSRMHSTVELWSLYIQLPTEGLEPSHCLQFRLLRSKSLPISPGRLKNNELIRWLNGIFKPFLEPPYRGLVPSHLAPRQRAPLRGGQRRGALRPVVTTTEMNHSYGGDTYLFECGTLYFIIEFKNIKKFQCKNCRWQFIKRSRFIKDDQFKYVVLELIIFDDVFFSSFLRKLINHQ